MILHILFFITLKIPKTSPMMQAKKRPKSARSSVRLIAVSSIGPYTVMILTIKPPPCFIETQNKQGLPCWNSGCRLEKR